MASSLLRSNRPVQLAVARHYGTIKGPGGLPDHPKFRSLLLRGNPRLEHHRQFKSSAKAMTQAKVNGAKANDTGPSVEERTANLVKFCSELTFDKIPADVVERTKFLFLDTVACCVAGHSHASVKAMKSFAKQMAPADGPCQLWFAPEERTTAAFAALVNGASSHVVELDDLNNRGMIHPATIVFPAAAAAAQDVQCTGEEFITACVAGYEAACRIGEFLGKRHYQDFHTTATAGNFGATAAVARILKLDVERTIWAFGTAGTQAAGLWEYMAQATHSKQIHTAKANFNGLLSAYTARDGLTGPTDILGGRKGMAACLADDTYPFALDDKLGERFTLVETSFKWHASCRHTHPSVDGLLDLMSQSNIKFQDIERVDCGVYQATLDILARGGVQSVHHSKFSMGFVLAVAAKYGSATINDFNEETLREMDLREFMDRVEMYLDKQVDDAFPRQWMARVKVTTKDGKVFETLVETPKGDPERTLTKDEMEFKAKALFDYGGWKDKSAQERFINRVWGLDNEKRISFSSA